MIIFLKIYKQKKGYGNQFKNGMSSNEDIAINVMFWDPMPHHDFFTPLPLTMSYMNQKSFFDEMTSWHTFFNFPYPASTFALAVSSALTQQLMKFLCYILLYCFFVVDQF